MKEPEFFSTSSAMYGTTRWVGPHDFAPARFLDRFSRLGSCAFCFWPRDVHPIVGRTPLAPGATDGS